MVVTTHFGLEEVLKSELEQLGATDFEILTRAVKCKGNDEVLYKANLLLRTGIRVLKPIAQFEAKDEHQLYEQIKRIAWDSFFMVDKTFAIDGATSGTIFTHSKYVALKSKDAIADQFREKFENTRPSVDPNNPDVRINVHIQQSLVTVSLDSSGDSLGRRNYRLEQTDAPINEVLAAGIILLSGWDRKTDFVDPMCGSGTFPIEAALLAGNIPSGRNRNFGFEKWSDFDASLWNKIKSDAEAAIQPIQVPIWGSDNDSTAIKIAGANAQRAGVLANIQFSQQDFFLSSFNERKGFVIMNPPYGERLLVDEVVDFYKAIGTRFKHFYEGCDAWLISSNYEGLKHFGLKPSKKIKLFNGPLECRLNRYELYRGSKKVQASV